MGDRAHRKRAPLRHTVNHSGNAHSRKLVAPRDEDWDACADNVNVQHENTYRMRPEDAQKFLPWKVERLIRDVLSEKLDGKTYDSLTCSDLSKEIAASIKLRCKALQWPRYKLIVNVLLAQYSQQSMQVASRCMWDVGTDSFACVSYNNKSIVAVAACYGVYLE